MTENHNKADLLGIPVDALTMEETLALIDGAISSGQNINHAVINAWTMVAMQKDAALKKSVSASDLISADGQSIVWACSYLGRPLPERVPGTEVMDNLVELAANKGHKVFFLGAKEEVVQKVVQTYSDRLGNEVIAGFRNGYFKEEDETEIARQIGESGAQILFIAMPSPQKENFIFNHNDLLRGVYYKIGIGGAFDVVAGVTKRAPKWMQRNGLEWFYRFIQEPRRMWKRYFIGNFQYVFLILKEKARQKKSK
jgi:N-acetylglucosaminyldiphosphoundecaprenol N-acetyl-beta-D-mannosaminyltransferase